MGIREHFVRCVPEDPKYQGRLELELSWFEGTKAESYLLRVASICKEIRDIPHIIRGSAGSSLVVYLLGISDIDPIFWEIAPERFFHPKRKSLPDIDLDFPDNRRDEVFERIFNLFPGKVARISNHVKYNEKGSIREAVRRLGYRKRLPAKFRLADVVPGQEQRAIEIASELQGQIKDISLHCGGVIVFEDRVPSEIQTKDPNQVRLDKLETEKAGYMKIDILSSISLTQLDALDSRSLDSYPIQDEMISSLLSSGNSFGITQAESPAFQKMLRALKPKQLSDIVLCMALIRPASAWRAHRHEFMEDWNRDRKTDLMVFEDDATRVISSLTGLSGSESDEIRRAFMKKDYELTKSFREKLGKTIEGQGIVDDIEAFRTFSMCKSHSVSYGRVTWALAWHKAYNPKPFWKVALNHAKSMWRPWVHVEEAKLAGWNILPGKKPFLSDGDTLYSDGAVPSLFEPDSWWELKKWGMWSGNCFPDGCGKWTDEEKTGFVGVIGTHRMLKNDDRAVTFATIGTSPGNYTDIIIDGAVDLKEYTVIEGTGSSYVKNGSESVKLSFYKLKRI